MTTLEMNFVVPAAQTYVQALKTIDISDSQRKMLAFHYHAHNRTITHAELAEAMGYKGADGAKLHYGKLGRAIGELLNMEFVPAENRNNQPFYTSAIGVNNAFQSSDTDYQLIMHHELAKALEILEWVEK